MSEKASIADDINSTIENYEEEVHRLNEENEELNMELDKIKLKFDFLFQIFYSI